MKIKGRCLNIGKPCSKALSGEIIEANESQFICPECGSILMPWMVDNQQADGQSMQSTNNGDFNNPPQKNKDNYLILYTALFIVAAAIGAWFWLSSKVQDQKLRMNLSESQKELMIGDVFKLVASFTPDDKNREVVWGVDNPEIASVDNGIVTALKEGETEVMAWPKDEKGLVVRCKIKVKNQSEPNSVIDDGIKIDKVENTADERITDEETIPEPPRSEFTMSITRQEMNMTVNDKHTLIAYVKNRKGENIRKYVEWSSSNPDVASVENGKVTAHRSGKAIITCTTTDKNINDVKCVVTVQTTNEVEKKTAQKPSVQTCFSGHAQYNSKTRTVTFTKDIVLEDDNNGEIIFIEGETITDVKISNGQLKYGKYKDRKGKERTIININKNF